MSASTVARLKTQWQGELAAWNQRRLDELEVVYLWVDGVYVKAGLEDRKAAVLVAIAALSDGRKVVLALRSGQRESTADRGYDTNANHQRLKVNGQRSSLIVKRGRTNPEVLGQADPDSQRERPGIERKFAEQKRYHGLRQARYWGLAKVTLQALLTCLVVNCKRLAKLLQASSSPPRAGLCLGNDTGRWKT